MYISKIKIQNFRGIQSMNEYINMGDLSTFVGRNDIGKSTIINALGWFFDQSTTGNKLPEIDFNYNTEGDVEIECFFSNVDKDLLNYFINQKKQITGSEECSNYCINNDCLILKKTYSRETGKGKYEIWLNEFLGYEDLIYKSSTDLGNIIKKANISVPKTNDTGRNADIFKIKLILDYCKNNNIKRVNRWTEGDKDIAKILPNFELFKADYSLEIKDNFDNKFSSEIKNVLDSSTEDLNRVSKSINEILEKEANGIQKFLSEYVSDLDKLEIKVKPVWYDAVKKVDVSFKLKNDHKEIPIENKGTGYRRLLMVARLRYLAQKNADTNTIYAIEEPETYLHPKAQEELLEALKIISEKNQIILTTHSTIFARNTICKDLVLVTKSNNASIYKQEENCDNDIMAEIIKELGIKPSHNLIEGTDHSVILFTEGSGDEKFIRIAAQKLGFEELNQNILVIFGGGETLSEFVDLQYWKGNRRILLSIIDSDIFDESDESIEKGVKNSLKAKQIKNQSYKLKFDEKYGSCFILSKRNIENYYHPQAILRVAQKFNPNLTTLDFPVLFKDTDCVNKVIADKKSKNTVYGNINGLKCKNNNEIFEEMTIEEWKEVSDGELEEIFENILKLIKPQL